MVEKFMDRKTFLRKAPLVFLSAFGQGVREARRPTPEVPLPLLRPPGAAPKEEFLDLCCGIGACAEVCPADAIQLRPREGDPDRLAPIIVPDEAACIVCEDLACMAACPSGTAAISMVKTAHGKGPVVKAGCIGCGMCEYYCPTDPPAIRVFEEE
jgi:ferredoxin